MREIHHVPFYEIVERIKDIISDQVDGRVYDRHVADTLGLTTNSLRVYKSTDHLPAHHLVIFCFANDVSFDWLVFDRK